MSIQSLLKQLKFSEPYEVAGQASIDGLFTENRCGIYVLHFGDNVYYAGKSINIANRYKQHRQNHRDIEKISFKLIPKDMLDIAEKEAIKALELEAELRNISLVTDPKRDMPLDDIFSPDEQTTWLESHSPIIKHRSRAEQETLRKKYSAVFARIMKNTDFTEKSLPVMRKYVECCIPEPFLTEVDFWSVSCLNRGGLYSRINIYWQEILRLGEDHVAIFLMDSELNKCHDFHPQSLMSLKFKSPLFPTKLYMRYPSLIMVSSPYAKNGLDQCCLIIEDYEDALKILDEPIIRRAIKAFTLSSMRKGPTVFSRYHSVDLADDLLKAFN